jgi:hypothetical protein
MSKDLQLHKASFEQITQLSDSSFRENYRTTTFESVGYFQLAFNSRLLVKRDSLFYLALTAKSNNQKGGWLFMQPWHIYSTMPDGN